MSQSHVTNAMFTSAFAALTPAILSEWAELDAAALLATQGELDQTVALVAQRTQHTKALARQQLEELYDVVTRPRYDFLGGPRNHVRKNFAVSVLGALSCGFVGGLLLVVAKLKK